MLLRACTQSQTTRGRRRPPLLPFPAAAAGLCSARAAPPRTSRAEGAGPADFGRAPTHLQAARRGRGTTPHPAPLLPGSMEGEERGGSTSLPPRPDTARLGPAAPAPGEAAGAPRPESGPSPRAAARRLPAAAHVQRPPPRAAPEGDRGRARPVAGTGGAVAAATRRDMAAGGREPGLWERVCAGGSTAPSAAGGRQGAARPWPSSALRACAPRPGRRRRPAPRSPGPLNGRS